MAPISATDYPALPRAGMQPSGCQARREGHAAKLTRLHRTWLDQTRRDKIVPDLRPQLLGLLLEPPDLGRSAGQLPRLPLVDVADDLRAGIRTRRVGVVQMWIRGACRERGHVSTEGGDAAPRVVTPEVDRQAGRQSGGAPLLLTCS